MPQVQKESIISIYINTLSNHPLAIFKQVSQFVCDRGSSNSSKRGVFDHAKAECEMPLRKIGYTANLESGSTRENTNKIKKINQHSLQQCSEDESENYAFNPINKHFLFTSNLLKIFNRAQLN